MPKFRFAARPLQNRAAACLALAAAFAAAAPSAASAETRVRAKYQISYIGLDVGTVTMQAGVDNASYNMNLSMRMTGLAKFFTNGRGAVTARGAVENSHVSPSTYALNTKSEDKGQVVLLAMAGGAVRQISLDPPLKTKNIIPVSDADKKGIIDPLSAMMMPVAGSGDLLDRSSCDRKLPVFDGRARFDVTLRYDRMEKTTPEASKNGGYDGKLIVCKATYKAISGHKPGKESVEFMEKNKDMEVWLAPIEGTRTLLPWKISVKTPVGTAIITATSFVVGDKTAGPAKDDKPNQKGVNL